MSDTGKNPKSRFIRVKCRDCDNVQTVFDRASSKVVCQVCGSTMVLPRGGKAEIHGEILERVDKDIE